MNTPDSKNTQNRPSFSCGLHYVRAFTGWPMLNNAGNSFENLTWCSELDCIFSLPQLIYFWLISNKNYNPLIRYQWFGKDCLLIFNPFYKCARIKDRFFKQMSTERMIWQVYGSLPHDWKSIKMSRFHGSITRTENWPLIRANKTHECVNPAFF